MSHSGVQRFDGQRGEGRSFRQTAAEARGMVLMMTLIVLFALGMFLVGFLVLTQSEGHFAGLNRGSVQALALAEAGAQDAWNRLQQAGKFTSTYSFTNSLASRYPGSSATVTFQPGLQADPQVFPVLSTATYGGATRAVRIYVRAIYKPGNGNVLLGDSVTFKGDASYMTGDIYSQTDIQFASYKKAPECSTGDTATNLLSPQVMAGTTISAGTGKVNPSAPCGDSSANATYTWECSNAAYQLSEVAPTPCGRSTGTGVDVLPQNWHPQTPLGMTSADFNAVITVWNGNNANFPPGSNIQVVQATQNRGVGVTYTSAGTYTPSYWTTVPSTNGRMLLVTSPQPFCVNSTTGQVQLPVPLVTGNCNAGFHLYGNQSGGTPYLTRYLDWGIVTDDLTRDIPQTFFEAPACSAPCLNPGYQNGIRYVPLPTPINFALQTCKQYLSPGLNIFDQVIVDGISCPNPPITTWPYPGQTNVTFTGTYSNPESLAIDNVGTPVTITGSTNGSSSLTCSNVNWQNYNWGMIIASGDLNFTGNSVFSGLIYTPGNISIGGTVLIQGAIIKASSFSQTNTTGTAGYCGGSNPFLVSPTFFNLQRMTWQDVPLNKP